MTGMILNYNRRPLPVPDDKVAEADIRLILSQFSPEEIGACLSALRAGTLDGNNPYACLYGVVAAMHGLQFWQIEGENVYRPGVRWMVAYIRAGQRNEQAERLEEWLIEALAGKP